MTKRRGNRRRQQAKREPNGRIQRASRAEQREDVTKVVREARQRVYHLSAAKAAEMPETSVLGRLRAINELSQPQYDAACTYIAIVRERNRMIEAKPVKSGGDLDRSGGFDASDGTEESYRRRYQRALDDFNAIQDALREANKIDAHSASVVHAVCMSDWDLPHFVPTLRLALNYVANAVGKVDNRFGIWSASELQDAV